MRLSRLVPVLALLTVLLPVWACGGGGGEGGGPTAPSAPLNEAAVEFESFDLANNARQQNQINQLLSFEDRIALVARQHSEAMRDQGFFSHNDPTTGNLRTRLRAAGISYSSAGENLAQVQNAGNPAGFAHNQLMNSDSHRSNILNEEFVAIGVGVARQGSSYWITQIFVTP
jgi:uncharacterized protein YkwD